MTEQEYKDAVADAMLNGTTPPAKPKTFDEARLHPILSNEEYRATVAKAKERILEQQKDAAIAHLLEAETARLQREEGLYTGDPAQDEEVKVLIDLPEFASYLSLNGLQFWHGHSYKQPRHVTNTLREMQQRAWNHQAEIDGKSKIGAYQRPLFTTVSGKGGVANPPQLALAGAA
jgi:hypothetical protein